MNFVFSLPIAVLSQYIFGPIIFLLSLFMILLILVQRGKGGGLTGALGGPGGQSAFGTKAGDLFTRITVVAAACWIFLLAFAVWWYTESGFSSALADNDGRGAGPSITVPVGPISGSPSTTVEPGLLAPPTGTNDSTTATTPPATIAPSGESTKATAEISESDLPLKAPASNSEKEVAPAPTSEPAVPAPAATEPATAEPSTAAEPTTAAEPKVEPSTVPVPEK